jgi:hypothetical protein
MFDGYGGGGYGDRCAVVCAGGGGFLSGATDARALPVGWGYLLLPLYPLPSTFCAAAAIRVDAVDAPGDLLHVIPME